MGEGFISFCSFWKQRGTKTVNEVKTQNRNVQVQKTYLIENKSLLYLDNFMFEVLLGLTLMSYRLPPQLLSAGVTSS